jgi:hypothetical protein
MNQQQILEALKEDQWDDPSPFFVSSEWKDYKEQLWNRIVDCHFKIADLQPEKPDFMARYSKLQGYIDCLYMELWRFEVKSRRIPHERQSVFEQERKQGLASRIITMIKDYFRSQ